MPQQCPSFSWLSKRFAMQMNNWSAKFWNTPNRNISDSLNMVIRTAICRCWQLSATCEDELVRISVCHWLECQRRIGSAFAIAQPTYLNRKQYRWIYPFHLISACLFFWIAFLLSEKQQRNSRHFALGARTTRFSAFCNGQKGLEKHTESMWGLKCVVMLNSVVASFWIASIGRPATRACHQCLTNLYRHLDAFFVWVN